MSDSPLVSICLVTRNRKEDLRVALSSCRAQDYEPKELLVFDGASSDGTVEMVRSEFPEVRLSALDTDPGFPRLRRLSLTEARGEMAFTMDDDAYFTHGETLRQAVGQLRVRPEAAVLALPMILAYAPPRLHAKIVPTTTEHPRLGTFTCCAALLRREAALTAGGFRDTFSYWKEDRDLSIRLLEHGFSILLGRTPPLVHRRHQGRDWKTRFMLDVRAALLFDAILIPHPYMFPRLLVDALRMTIYRSRLRDMPGRAVYVARELRSSFRHKAYRAPVSVKTYRLYRSLPSHGSQAVGNAGVPPPCGTIDSDRPPTPAGSSAP